VPAGLLRVERIAAAIHIVRGQRVMLDADLAALYGVTTKRLNEQVKRNRDRFPKDFAFRLTADELAVLRSRIATSKVGRGGPRYTPMVFTEHGAVMLASILSSPIAVQASIQVVRAFLRLRHMLETNADLARKLDVLEKRYDGQFRVVFQAIRQLMVPPGRKPRRIGFATSRLSAAEAAARHGCR